MGRTRSNTYKYQLREKSTVQTDGRIIKQGGVSCDMTTSTGQHIFPIIKQGGECPVTYSMLSYGCCHVTAPSPIFVVYVRDTLQYTVFQTNTGGKRIGGGGGK